VGFPTADSDHGTGKILVTPLVFAMICAPSMTDNIACPAWMSDKSPLSVIRVGQIAVARHA
jgi:hypothetical protein